MMELSVGRQVINSLRSFVDDAVVIVNRINWHMVRFANNEPTIVNNWVQYSVDLYVAKSRKFLTTTITSIEPREVIDKATGLAKQLDSVPEDPFFMPLTHVGKVGELSGAYDGRVEGGLDILTDKLYGAIQASLAEGSERNAGALTFGVVSRYYVDSTDLELEGRYSFIALTIRAFSGDVSATSTAISRSIDNFKAEEAGREAGRMVSMGKGLPVEGIEPGRYNTLLSPLVSGHLYGLVVSMWFNAYSILIGLSGIIKEDVGKEVANESLSLMDMSSEGTLLGSEAFDYEGNPTRNVEIINKGVLKSLLHNNRTAVKFGVESTGNATDLDGMVRPGPRHVAISTGSMPNDLEDLLRDLNNGVFIGNNWYTRFQNVREGMFSTVARDLVLLVRNGKPTARLKGVRIADTFKTLLTKYAGASKGAWQVYWWDMDIPSTAPYVLINELGLSKGPE